MFKRFFVIEEHACIPVYSFNKQTYILGDSISKTSPYNSYSRFATNIYSENGGSLGLLLKR